MTPNEKSYKNRLDLQKNQLKIKFVQQQNLFKTKAVTLKQFNLVLCFNNKQ